MKNILSLLASIALFSAAPALAQNTLTDGQISKVLMTVNEGEIDAAKLAKGKVKNNDIKNFAQMMIDGHNKNTKETKDLAKKNKLDVEKSDLSKSLAEQATTANKELKKNDKNAMDKAYINQQIDMHEKALTLLKDTLIPQATNADLKAHLAKTQTDVEEHLSHARKLQTDIQ